MSNKSLANRQTHIFTQTLMWLHYAQSLFSLKKEIHGTWANLARIAVGVNIVVNFGTSVMALLPLEHHAITASINIVASISIQESLPAQHHRIIAKRWHNCIIASISIMVSFLASLCQHYCQCQHHGFITRIVPMLPALVSWQNYQCWCLCKCQGVIGRIIRVSLLALVPLLSCHSCPQ